jgi:hypothetical protein
MDTILPLRKVRDFGEKISDTIQFIRAHWKNLLVMYGLIVLPLLLVAVFLGAGFFMDVFTKLNGDIRALQQSWKIVAAGILIFFAFSAMAAAIYIYMEFLETNGRPPSIGEVVRALPAPFFRNLLYSLILMLFSAALLVPVFLMISGSGSKPVLLGFMFFIIMVAYLLLMPYIVLIYPCSSIKHSAALGNPLRAPWRLLRGNWWSSLGYILVLFLIYYILSFITQIGLTIVMGLTGLLGSGKMMQDSGKFMSMLYGLIILVQQVFYIFFFVGIGILYYSLQEQKLGSGLESRINEIGNNTGRGSVEGEY